MRRLPKIYFSSFIIRGISTKTPYFNPGVPSANVIYLIAMLKEIAPYVGMMVLGGTSVINAGSH
jgi:hypothetical protein